MKHILVLLFLINTLICNAYEYNVLETHPINIELDKCMKDIDSTQAMNKCMDKAQDNWYKEIELYLGKLKNVTNEGDYQNILKSHEDWKKYINSENKVNSIIINKKGTMFQNIVLGAETSLVKDRAIYLIELYNALK